jgi:hypothetical protein
MIIIIYITNQMQKSHLIYNHLLLFALFISLYVFINKKTKSVKFLDSFNKVINAVLSLC